MRWSLVARIHISIFGLTVNNEEHIVQLLKQKFVPYKIDIKQK